MSLTGGTAKVNARTVKKWSRLPARAPKHGCLRIARSGFHRLKSCAGSLPVNCAGFVKRSTVQQLPAMTLRTLNDIFFNLAARNQPQCLLRKAGGKWYAISSSQLCGKVRGTATAIAAWGVARGERIAILSENRHEWLVADLACLMLGVVVVPIYATLTPEQSAFMLRDSGARAIFVSSEKLLQKVLSIARTTGLKHIVVMDEVANALATRMAEFTALESSSELDERGHSVQPDDLATIIYTSGTTGTPKGVMLSHGNMAENINFFCRDFAFGPGMSCISFLPLSHVTARCVDLGLLNRGVMLAHLPDINQLTEAFREIRPHIVLSVPRVYEKVRDHVELNAARFPKKEIYQWALSVGRRHREEILAGTAPHTRAWKVANKLVYSKICAGMGGRAQVFISGGAPLGKKLAEWFADIGIRICEGYGLTETSPVIAVNTPQAHRVGSVGKPLGNVEVRIAEDGEILVRGPSVFKGYWKNPAETQNAFINGWLKTGDLGHLDQDGFLYVTDRKKDLLKTSGGKFISPQPIEIALKHHPWIAEAVIIGDKRKFPSVLLLPNFTVVESWARDQAIAFGSRQELVSRRRIHARFEEIVEDINQGLAQFEKLKKFVVLTEDFSPMTGTMTASMKVRRRAVEEYYHRQIAEMYEEGEKAKA